MLLPMVTGPAPLIDKLLRVALLPTRPSKVTVPVPWLIVKPCDPALVPSIVELKLTLLLLVLRVALVPNVTAPV